MQNVLILETNKYAIKLQNFEGPLDLLCHLIDKNKMDIYDNKIRMSALLDKNGSDKLGGICFGEGGVKRYDLDGEREFDYICARSASYDRYKTEVL